MASENIRKESPDGEVIEQEVFKKDGREIVQKDRVAEAVRRMRPKAPINQAAGLFMHPSTFTEEEINYTVDCLKQNIPIYVIANMLQCERHTLSRLINSIPELKSLKEAKYENMLDEAEFQLDRLNKAGNAATIMFTLERQGWKRGWGGAGVQSGDDGGGGQQSRIVMGVIPDEAVKEAEETVKAKQGSDNPGSAVTDPIAMAMMEQKIKEEVEKKVEESKPVAIEADAVSEPPYKNGESVVDIDNQNSFQQYSQMGGYGQGQGDDPWASGGDSMFFQ
jgi:hypothetical protein